MTEGYWGDSGPTPLHYRAEQGGRMAGSNVEVRFADRPLPQWFDDVKFGIFIHWGPYAVPCYAPVDHDMGVLMRAGNWADVFRYSPYTEWYLNSWAIPGSDTAAHHLATYGDRTYESFVEEFQERSRGCGTADWVPLFAQAGARYVVPVTKHHDGFLMWRSGVANPHRGALWTSERDHVGELATAVRSAGMRLGLYYSGGIDWTFRPPPISDLRGLANAAPEGQDYGDYAVAQVHELIDRFQPDVLWNDITWPNHLDPNDVFEYYYDAVPHGLVNDRWGYLAVAQGRLHVDFTTPEYTTRPSSGRKWEVCRGIGRSFGYNRMEDESTFPSVDELVWMLADIVANGGNLLLNVGPSADGQIPMLQALRLTALGWWLRVNGDAIYGTKPAGTSTTTEGRPVCYTFTESTAYALVQGAPNHEVSLVMGALSPGAEVRMLGNDRSLPYRWSDGVLRVALPDHLPPAPVTVLALTGFTSVNGVTQ